MEKEKRKNLIVYSLILISGLVLGWLIWGGTNDRHAAHDQEAESGAAVIYTCSMHPQVRQPAPGDCPICGMDLIPATEADDMGEDDPFYTTLQDRPSQWANIRTQRAGTTDQAHSIRLSGQVVANEQNTNVITANFPGRIEQLYADYTGRFIRRGERLARIYSPELMQAQQELIQASASKDQMGRMYEAARQRLRLFRLTESQIDAIEQSGEASPVTDFYASQSGFLIQRDVLEGDYVSVGQPMFTLTDLSSVWVELDVYETQMTRISRGDEAQIQVAALPGRTLTGKVEFTDPFLNPETRTARARLTVKNPDNQLRPGMLVDAVISGSQTDGSQLVIPHTAVLWTGQRSVVYVRQPSETGMRFEFREIETGARTQEGYIVLSGLEADEEIAVNGVFAIDAAAQLRGHYSMMSPPQRAQMAEPFLSNLKLLFENYFAIKNALAADDGSKAATMGKRLLQQLETTGEHSLAGEHHVFWMQQYQSISEHTRYLIGAGDIKKMRVHFEPLSQAFIETARTLGAVGQTFYVAFCPMVDDDRGAYWLSEFEEISNPYFGAMMLRCGEVREVLREGIPAGQVRETREMEGHVH